MTVKEHLDKYNDPHRTARAMVGDHLTAICGLGIDDLSDTCMMADAVDTVADLLEGGEIEAAKAEIRLINLEFVMENEF
jgi:hypothetical protein